MMCFRDMTFCGSDCATVGCHRFFGEREREAAQRWWGSPDAPVSFADFSAACANYSAGNATSIQTAIKVESDGEASKREAHGRPNQDSKDLPR